MNRILLSLFFLLMEISPICGKNGYVASHFPIPRHIQGCYGLEGMCGWNHKTSNVSLGWVYHCNGSWHTKIGAVFNTNNCIKMANTYHWTLKTKRETSFWNLVGGLHGSYKASGRPWTYWKRKWNAGICLGGELEHYLTDTLVFIVLADTDFHSFNEQLVPKYKLSVSYNLSVGFRFNF